MTLLIGKDITKVYGGKNGTNSTQALQGIDIRIDSGEFVGVMGPSGSGKTTLLNVLSGIDKPTSGAVKIRGQSLTNMSNDELALFRRQKLGFIFQEFNLLDSLTIKENVLLPMIMDKKTVSVMENKAKEILQLFGIYDLANKYPYNVSGGQQQRAAVSRALINDPEVIFADEPTGNLDSNSAKVVMQSLTKLNDLRKTTILMVTHDPFAASFCQRIIFIKDGKIHSEISKKGPRKAFFDHILDCLAVLGGEANDL